MLEDRQLILRARLLCFWEEIKSLRTEIIFFSVVNYTNRPRLDSRDHELNYPCSIIIGFLHVRDFFILEERGALSLRSWIHSLNSVLSYIVLRSCIALPVLTSDLVDYVVGRSTSFSGCIVRHPGYVCHEFHVLLQGKTPILVVSRPSSSSPCPRDSRVRARPRRLLFILSRGCVLARKAALNHVSQDQGLSGDCLRGNRQPLEVPRSDNNSCNSCKSCKRLQTFHG